MAQQLVDVPDRLSDAVNDLYQRGWTDGLPVIPPTPELVDAMLSSGDFEPERLVATIPLAATPATVHAIAVNAVMAGCPPGALGTVIATVQAMCEPQFNLRGITGTTDTTSPGVLLNGPVRASLDVNCGEGVAGPGWQANATIGRAVRLILMNLGGAVPGRIDRSMMGQPAKYTFCLGENEEESPWEPYHVAEGFAADDSVVTVVPVSTTDVVWPIIGLVEVESTLAGMVDVMKSPYRAHALWALGKAVTWVIPPANAKLLARAGFTRQTLQQYLFEHARIPVADYPGGRALFGGDIELPVSGDDVLLVARPEDVKLFVSGGLDYTGALFLDGWDSDPVSVAIEQS